MTRPLSRRQMLRAGALGWCGLSLADLLRAEAARAAGPARACILLYYYGGPSHLDTWDLKPSAPAEVRGEFRSIATTVPGLRVCEHMPHTARVAHKLAVVRSVHHPMRNHNSAAVEMLCGRTPANGDLELLNDDANSFPCYGAAMSALKPTGSAVPSHVALPHVMHNVVQLPGQTAGFLGAAHNPYQIARDPTRPDFRIDELALPGDLSAARMADRRELLARVESRGRMIDHTLTAHQGRAFDILSSEATRNAFDLPRETTKTRDRYGRDRLGQSLLLARRLVQAGVRLVNVNDKITNGQTANWDSHENNFPRLKDDLLPPADLAFSALVEDLDARGLLDSTLVIACAEFGRTPKINGNRGRDHWPDCFSVVLAGGGVRGGAVYGASDRLGAFPAADPVSTGDLAATLFWRLGIDPKTEIRDRTGRAYHAADGDPLRVLFG